VAARAVQNRRRRWWRVTWRLAAATVAVAVGLPVATAGAQVDIAPPGVQDPITAPAPPTDTAWSNMNSFQKYLYCLTGQLDSRCTGVGAPTQTPTPTPSSTVVPTQDTAALQAETTYHDNLTAQGWHRIGDYSLPGAQALSAVQIQGPGGTGHPLAYGASLDMDINLEPGFDGFRNLISWTTANYGYQNVVTSNSLQINPTTGQLREHYGTCNIYEGDPCPALGDPNAAWWTQGSYVDLGTSGGVVSGWHHLSLSIGGETIVIWDGQSLTHTDPFGTTPGMGPMNSTGYVSVVLGELAGPDIAGICGDADSCANWPTGGVVGRVGNLFSKASYAASTLYDIATSSMFQLVSNYHSCPATYCGLPYIGTDPTPVTTTTLVPEVPAPAAPTPTPTVTEVPAPAQDPSPSTTPSTAPAADPGVSPSTTTDKTLGDRIGGFFGDLLRGLWNLFVYLVTSLWEMFTWLVARIWEMFTWLVARLWEMFTWLVAQLGALIRWLAAQIWAVAQWFWGVLQTALTWLLDQLLQAFSWLGHFIIDGFNAALQWLLNGITADFQWLLTQLTSVLTQLFVPHTTMTAWLDTAFPNGLPAPSSTQVVDVIPKPPTVGIDPNPTDPLPPVLGVPPVNPGLACGPSFHIPDPINKTYYAPTPSDSGCPGNGPDGVGA
jgi:hypothetical protein